MGDHPYGNLLMADYTDIRATVGGSDSNSYVTGEEADTFAEFQSWETAWSDKTESERTIALINAARWLDTIDFEGTRCDPSSDDEDLPQARVWPRSDASCDGVAATCSFIPQAIKDAQVLIAYNLVIDPEMITGPGGGAGSGAASGTYVSKNQLGDLVQEFSAYPSGEHSGNDCVDCSTPEVIAKLPWLKGFLSCWADISTDNSKILLRVRS